MAIALGEAEQESFNRLIKRAERCQLSAGTWIELAAVTARYPEHIGAAVNQIMAHYGIAIAPVTVEQARIGSDAYRRYGRGSGHPANLNFGDCFAYALALESDEPLLFKGNDFTHTDVLAAL